MPPRMPLPEPFEQGSFTTAQAMDGGVGRGRLRGDDIQHPFRGLNTIGVDLADLVSRCEALVPLLGAQQWVSHLTAARLWGMPTPTFWTVEEPIHTTALAGTHRMQRAGIVGWETDRPHTPKGTRGTIPVFPPATVWAQLSMPGTFMIRADAADPESPVLRRGFSKESLVAVGDFLLSGPRAKIREPLCTLEDLADALRQHRGKRGAKSLAWAIDRVRSPVDSPKETQLRLGLVEHGLPEPAVQVPVRTSSGLRHADLGYPDARLLLEFQGDEHRSSRSRWMEDLTRVQLFQDAGYRVIAVTDADITPDCRALATRVRRALAGRTYAAPPGADPER